MYGRTDLPDRGRHSRSGRPVERGFVVSTYTVDANEEPRVRVETRTNRVTDARVLQHVAGDTGVPAEGTEVYVLRRTDNVPLVIGVVGTDHDGYEDERTFSHPHSDAEVRFSEDGDIHIETSGDVYINGINFESHTHDYSWTDSGGSGTTDEPN